jgi:hypothetical protein
MPRAKIRTPRRNNERATRGATFANISAFALTLPGVEARTSFGTPALFVGKKFMARLRDDDRDTMVLKPVEDDEQRFLMETQPGVFFKTPHYAGYPAILIRLSKVDPAQLCDLVEGSWRRLATKTMLKQRDGSGAAADARVRLARQRILRR